MKSVICLFAVLAVASALPWDQSCPSLAVQDPFTLSSFVGTWYKQYALNTPWELGTCITATYTLNETSGEVAIDNTLKTIFGGTAEVRGTATLANSSSTEGVLDVTITNYFGDVSTEMSILSTDYENYAIAYTCREVSISWWSAPFESVWVLTRDRELTSDVSLLIQAAMAVIAHDGGPSFSQLGVSSQEDCS